MDEKIDQFLAKECIDTKNGNIICWDGENVWIKGKGIVKVGIIGLGRSSIGDNKFIMIEKHEITTLCISVYSLNSN